MLSVGVGVLDDPPMRTAPRHASVGRGAPTPSPTLHRAPAKPCHCEERSDAAIRPPTPHSPALRRGRHPRRPADAHRTPPSCFRRAGCPHPAADLAPRLLSCSRKGGGNSPAPLCGAIRVSLPCPRRSRRSRTPRAPCTRRTGWQRRGCPSSPHWSADPEDRRCRRSREASR